ncbi:MAG: transposase [Ktedonobacterales bacterium]|nr:transposase [Ktedonobacterales bacterium]
MNLFPAALVSMLFTLLPAFTRPTFDHACEILAETLLTSRRRTSASALRAVGRAQDAHFTTYHRVFNCAVWSPLLLSRRILHCQRRRKRLIIVPGARRLADDGKCGILKRAGVIPRASFAL